MASTGAIIIPDWWEGQKAQTVLKPGGFRIAFTFQRVVSKSGLTMSLRGFRMPQTFSGATAKPSSSLASLNAVATTSLSDGSAFPPAKLQMTEDEERSRTQLIPSLQAVFSYRLPDVSLVSALQRAGSQSEQERRLPLNRAERDQDRGPFSLTLALAGSFPHFIRLVQLQVRLQRLSTSGFILQRQTGSSRRGLVSRSVELRSAVTLAPGPWRVCYGGERSHKVPSVVEMPLKNVTPSLINKTK